MHHTPPLCRTMHRHCHWMSFHEMTIHAGRRTSGIELLRSLFFFPPLSYLARSLPSRSLANKSFLSQCIHPTADPARLPSTIRHFLLTGLLPPHRFPLLFQCHCFYMFFLDVTNVMDIFWMDGLELCFITTLDLMRGLTHTPSHKAQWYLVYTSIQHDNDKGVYL